MNFWTDPIGLISQWLVGLLTGWGLSSLIANTLVTLLGVIVLIVFALALDISLVWVERKVVARFQDRVGPNRLGPFGIFQPFADIVKLIIKEDITPIGAEKLLYNFAPILAMASVLLTWAIIPFASKIYGVDLNVAVLYLVAVGALGTLAVIMGGWSSNNKYALIGAFRMVATMISYEIPMVIALLVPTLLAGTMSMKGITEAQSVIWFVILSPLSVLIFIISAIAELGRAPFDLHEAESEIVAGYYVEYSGMKFGLFYASELLHAFTFGTFIGVLFFGGWNWPLPWGDKYPLLGFFNVLAKGMFFYWVIMWVRYTMPRIRIDHLLTFNWKFLTPLAFVVLMTTALLTKLLTGAAPWLYILGLFTSNLFIAWITIEILRTYGRRQRQLEKRVSKPAVRPARHSS